MNSIRLGTCPERTRRWAILLYVVFACSIMLSFFFSFRAGMGETSELSAGVMKTASDRNDAEKWSVGKFAASCSQEPTKYAYCMNDPKGQGIYAFSLWYMETREFRFTNQWGTWSVRVAVNSGWPVRAILVGTDPLPMSKADDRVITSSDILVVPSAYTGGILYVESLAWSAVVIVSSSAAVTVNPPHAQIMLTEPFWSATRSLWSVRVDYFAEKSHPALDYQSYDMYIH